MNYGHVTSFCVSFLFYSAFGGVFFAISLPYLENGLGFFLGFSIGCCFFCFIVWMKVRVYEGAVSVGTCISLCAV